MTSKPVNLKVYTVTISPEVTLGASLHAIRTHVRDELRKQGLVCNLKVASIFLGGIDTDRWLHVDAARILNTTVYYDNVTLSSIVKLEINHE